MKLTRAEKEKSAHEELPKIRDRMLTQIEIQALLGGACRVTIYNMCRAGRFPPPAKIGSKNMWRQSIVEQWIEAQQSVAA